MWHCNLKWIVLKLSTIVTDVSLIFPLTFYLIGQLCFHKCISLIVSVQTLFSVNDKHVNSPRDAFNSPKIMRQYGIIIFNILPGCFHRTDLSLRHMCFYDRHTLPYTHNLINWCYAIFIFRNAYIQPFCQYMLHIIHIFITSHVSAALCDV